MIGVANFVADGSRVRTERNGYRGERGRGGESTYTYYHKHYYYLRYVGVLTGYVPVVPCHLKFDDCKGARTYLHTYSKLCMYVSFEV